MIEVILNNIEVESTEKKGNLSSILKIPYAVNTGDGISSCVEIDISEIGKFIGIVPPVLFDLLIFSGIIYSVDRTIPRKQYSINGLAREISLSLPTKYSSIWTPLKRSFESMLTFMTGDIWSIKFVQANEYVMPTFTKPEFLDKISCVSLFSGGMDSLIGAIDLANQTENKIFLASHYDSTMGGPKGDQDKVYTLLNNRYPGKFHRFNQPVKIQPLKQKKSELSSRSRSLMFFSIAAIIAEAIGKEFIIPENGSVSLNFPLSSSRRSACSTRTTHPVMVHQFNDLLINLGLKTRAVNPYEFKTKGEMVRDCLDRDSLLHIIPFSNSCGKRSQHQFMYDNRSATHCGRCMPCMYRKAAMLGYKDNTTYGISLSTLYSISNGKLSNDFYAMINFLAKPLSRKEIKDELFLLGMGEYPSLHKYIELVERTRNELIGLVLKEGNKRVKDYIL